MEEKQVETYTENLKAIIVENEGFILSDGTLNNKHLLSHAFNLCEQYALNVGLQEEILKVFVIDNLEEDEVVQDLFLKQYWGEASIPQEKEQEANEIWNEDVYNFFSSISPDGYYFGSSEGDGALIGWFKIDDSLE